MLVRTLLSRELILLGLRDLRAHKLRSFLTALGMIFGVGAVICMLSIGEGASAEQIESIRLLGSQNVIIRSVEPPSSEQAGDRNTRMKEYGVTREDLARLSSTLPSVEQIVKMREVAEIMTYAARKFDGHVLGTTPNLFDVINLRVARGRELREVDARHHAKVCVIGADVARSLFGGLDPLGQFITVEARSTGRIPYRVIGILSDVQTAGKPAVGAGQRNVNRDCYIPLSTADLRYGDINVSIGTFNPRKVEFSDVIVNVASEELVLPVSHAVQRVMEHGRDRQDYRIIVPLELLQQAKEAKRLWQTVLGSIAGVSLLVGGIGIMNIMLASVTERTREIGIRRALGAKKYHITAQFLIETVLLSVAGGIIGIIVGVGFANVVTSYVGWQTIVPMWGVALSFLVSAAVGISFGLYPARAAAGLDPIEALRYE